MSLPTGKQFCEWANMLKHEIEQKSESRIINWNVERCEAQLAKCQLPEQLKEAIKRGKENY